MFGAITTHLADENKSYYFKLTAISLATRNDSFKNSTGVGGRVACASKIGQEVLI
jgi:hypothetical protein